MLIKVRENLISLVLIFSHIDQCCILMISLSF